MGGFLVGTGRLLPAGAVAGAGILLIGGLAVAATTDDASVYSACLKNGALTQVTVGATPLQECHKSAIPVTWNQEGEPGAPGRDGVDGTDGADGKDGRDGVDGEDGRDGIVPAERATWKATYLFGSNSQGSVVSQDLIEPGARIAPVTATLTGDFEDCTYMATVEVLLEGSQTALARWSVHAPLDSPANTPASLLKADTVPTEASSGARLMTRVDCRNKANQPVAAPLHRIDFTFDWTHPLPTRSFE